jgi:cation transport ATPase
MASIKTMLPERTVVLRDGQQQHVEGAEIVPGDVLCIKMGDRMPAVGANKISVGTIPGLIVLCRTSDL